MLNFGISLGNQGLQRGIDTLKGNSSTCNNFRWPLLLLEGRGNLTDRIPDHSLTLVVQPIPDKWVLQALLDLLHLHSEQLTLAKWYNRAFNPNMLFYCKIVGDDVQNQMRAYLLLGLLYLCKAE